MRDQLPGPWSANGTAYPCRVVTPAEPAYAGAQLGLPAAGPGSLAPLGRRFVAIVIDWVIAQLVASFVLGANLSKGGSVGFVVLGVFAVLSIVSLTAVGATFGHWLLGLQLRQARQGAFVVQVLVRTALLCLFVPAVLTGSDGRGFHDRIAGTVLVRR